MFNAQRLVVFSMFSGPSLFRICWAMLRYTARLNQTISNCPTVWTGMGRVSGFRMLWCNAAPYTRINPVTAMSTALHAQHSMLIDVECRSGEVGYMHMACCVLRCASSTVYHELNRLTLACRLVTAHLHNHIVSYATVTPWLPIQYGCDPVAQAVAFDMHCMPVAYIAVSPAWHVSCCCKPAVSSSSDAGGYGVCVRWHPCSLAGSGDHDSTVLYEVLHYMLAVFRTTT